jgi:hypothetical protein
MQARWSKQTVIAAIREWARLYGAPPVAGEWNPSLAKRLGHNERVERFYAGRWPNYRTVVNVLGGWNEAIRAAGFAPRRCGAQQRTIPALSSEQAARQARELSRSPFAGQPTELEPDEGPLRRLARLVGAH